MESNSSRFHESDEIIQRFPGYLENGTYIYSSGSTGIPKRIFRSPHNISICNKIAIESQKINATSSIYTVTKMDHAGGLLAQTLPAFSIGAQVKVEKFDAYRFLREFKNHTHTFLPPDYMAALRKTKNFENYDFQGKWILTGSSPVSCDDIEAFVERNAIVQPNWGMSEVGPIAINTIFDSLEKVRQLRDITPMGHYILGDTFNVEYKIINGELIIKSDMCVDEGWFSTGDLVSYHEGTLFFKCRKI